MDFQISGLDATPFSHLYGMREEELRRHGAERHIALEKPGYPDRIELRDAEPGERLLLLNFLHQPADTPYRASHAIYILEGATRTCHVVNEVPPALRVRTLSLRAFDAIGHMVDADLVDGGEAEALIERLLARPDVAYLQAHYARRGCYAARIERA